MEEKRIPLRSEVPAEYTWDLTELFADEEEFLKECEELKKLPDEIEAFRGTLAQGPGRLLAYMRLSDDVTLRLDRLTGYAVCLADQDTGNNRSQDLKGRAMGTAALVMSAAAFAEPEIMAIPQETLDGFFRDEKELETYRRPLERIRRRAAHILSPECEKLLAEAAEAARAPAEISATLRNAELRFGDVQDSAGARHALTNSSFVPLLTKSDRVLRKNAFDAYYRVLGDFRNTLAGALNAQMKQLVFFSRARGYSSTLEASLDATEVPVSVYHNLIGAVHGNLDAMYRYVALRKRLLGVDELHMYDVYAPIAGGPDEYVPFEKAKQMVLEALSVLGSDYTDMLRTGFQGRWIDVYENTGKRSGAYSSGVARPHPYVLLNYHDDLDSAFTLAHEMGHALHSYHSRKGQNVCTGDYVIFVAEVASTCNEVLMMRYLLGRTTDRARRAALISQFLDKFKGTVFRQTMFAEFELMLGRMAEEGETITSDALCEKYGDINAAYFGPDMARDGGISLEWARIPHFYYNYYVFQYATGFSAAAAIADRILKEGESAVKDYKRFLSSGSSADPISLLKIAGVDMSTPDPVNRALRLFGELVDELEELTR